MQMAAPFGQPGESDEQWMREYAQSVAEDPGHAASMMEAFLYGPRPLPTAVRTAATELMRQYDELFLGPAGAASVTAEDRRKFAEQIASDPKRAASVIFAILAKPATIEPEWCTLEREEYSKCKDSVRQQSDPRRS